MFDKKMWKDTRDLMDFAEGGVVPKIYEYGSKQYPVWEKASKNNNAWLISTKILEPNNTPSLPHLRAEANGYYIYGFRVNESKDGRAKGELLRYLAGKKSSIQEWTVYAPDEDIITLNSQANYPESTNISTKSITIKTKKQEKQKEETTSFADTVESPISPAKLPVMPEYSGAEELKDIYNLAKNIFDNVRNNEDINKYAVGYPILWFGNLQAYKASPLRILTVGINPSEDEFTNNTFRRFPAWNELSVENYFKGLNEYFNEEAYNWFTQLSNSISLEAVWNCSYITNQCQNTALHIDFCTPIATKPTWSNGLPANVRSYLQEIQIDYFQQLLAFLNPDIVFIGSRQCDDWQTQDVLELLISREYGDNSPEISSLIEKLTTLKGEPHSSRNKIRCLKSAQGIFIITGQYRNRPFAVYAQERLRPIMAAIKEYYICKVKK